MKFACVIVPSASTPSCRPGMSCSGGAGGYSHTTIPPVVAVSLSRRWMCACVMFSMFEAISVYCSDVPILGELVDDLALRERCRPGSAVPGLPSVRAPAVVRRGHRGADRDKPCDEENGVCVRAWFPPAVE